MALTKTQKQKVIADLEDKIGRQKSIVFFDFTGMKVKDMSDLRKRLKKADSEVKVTKKTLLGLVFKKAGINLDLKKLKGEIALAFGFKDEISPAKICYQVSQGNPNLKILAGFFEGKVADLSQVVALAQLPSKDELLARLVGSISAPARNFVNVLQANIKGLINILAKAKT